MTKDLVIYGAGGFGREMALMVDQMNSNRKAWTLLGFFDDGKKRDESIDGYPVLGGMESLNALRISVAVVVALADPFVRKAIVEKIANSGISFPPMIHPKCLPGSTTNKFGKGCIVTAGCVLTTGIRLGDFVIVNLSTTIGHDVQIGSYTSVMPGANISGGVNVGERTLIGTGAQILQYRNVGSGCKIGAGAVVTRNIPDGQVIKGVPGRCE